MWEKRHSIIVGMLAIAMAFLFSFCGGGGGGDSTPAIPTNCVDAAGDWTVNATDIIIQNPGNYCTGGGAQPPEQLTIAQTGCGITVSTTTPGVGPFNGTIDGSTISWSGSYPDEGGTATITNLNGTLTGDPATSVTGSNNWSWGDGVGSCSGTSTFTGVKTSSPTTYTLTATAGTGGSVTKNPDQASYASGTTVTLTATAAAGFTFANWSGDLTGATNPATIVMNSNMTITANFTPVAPSNGIWDSSLWDDTTFVWGP